MLKTICPECNSFLSYFNNKIDDHHEVKQRKAVL